MNITVMLFARAKDLAGHPEVELEVKNGADVADVRVALLEKYPDLDKILPHCSFAVDQHYVGDDHAICERSEIGCIPPVSGG